MKSLRSLSRHTQSLSGGSLEKVQTLEIRLLPAASSLLLSSLNGTNGATFYGIDTASTPPGDFGDRSGWSVSGVGDVNGDGFDDMFVSARSADGSGNTVLESGESYLVFGKADWSGTPAFSFSTLNGTNGVTFYGIDTWDQSGTSVSGAGDVNDDGFADLLIGASAGDGVGNAKLNSGETYLVFGKSDWSSTPTVNLSSLNGTNGVTFYGVDSTDFSGATVTGNGDVNGDGIDDFMIGANSTRGLNDQLSTAGDIYLIFGKTDWSSTPSFDLSTLNGTNGVTLYGSASSAEDFGSAGDVNGDGFQDILINSSGSGASNSSVIFGKVDWSSTPVIDLFTATSPILARMTSPVQNTAIVVSKQSGDVNADGYDDFLLSFPEADGPGGTILNSGEAYLIFGRSNWSTPPNLSNPNGTDVVRFYGVDEGDSSGGVNIAGDLNGDGFDDLIISSFVADGVTNTASQTGEVYVIYGKANWQFTPNLYLSALDGNNGYTIYGINDHDLAADQSGAGDVNGDGIDDLLIGAMLADSINNSLSQAGEAYIVFGFDTANPLIDQIGVKRNAQFYQDLNNSFSSNTGDRNFSFGNPSDLPLVGDWNDDGIDEIGVFRSGSWYLDLNGNNIWDGTAGGDLLFSFGNPTDTPLIGDWNGDGIDDVGVKRGDAYYLDANGNRAWNGTAGGDSLYHFGNASDTPVVGDWNGNGHDKIGVFRNGTFYLDQNGNGAWNDTAGGDARFGYGMAGDKPIVGDWNGDGISDVGVVRGNSWYLDQNGNRAWNGTIGGDALFTYGNSTDTPLVGNWTAPSPSPKPQSKPGSPTQLDILFAQLAPPAKKPS